MVVFVVKRYAVREAKKWRYAVREAKIGRYAVRKGKGSVTLIKIFLSNSSVIHLCRPKSTRCRPQDNGLLLRHIIQSKNQYKFSKGYVFSSSLNSTFNIS